MAIDTDINNADSALWVEFYNDAVLQPFLSEQEGRPIYHDVVKIRIRIPGNDTLVIERPVEEGDKIRFPRHWAFFEAKAKNGDHPGTPLSEMPGITKATVENLRARGFYTVEQFAAASDQVLNSLGMNAGVSPTAFRDQCKRFLGAAADMAPTVRLEAELKQRDAKIAAMQAQLEQLIALQTQGAAPPVGVAAQEPPAFTDETVEPAAKPKLGLGALKADKAA